MKCNIKSNILLAVLENVVSQIKIWHLNHFSAKENQIFTTILKRSL